MAIQHAAVWLDHEEAWVLHVDPKSVQRSHLRVAHHLHHPHKTGASVMLPRDATVDHPFFDDIVEHLADVAEILVVGPGDTKLAFMKFVEERHQHVARKILGVEPADHPTDEQLMAHASRYFAEANRARSSG